MVVLRFMLSKGLMCLTVSSSWDFFSGRVLPIFLTRVGNGAVAGEEEEAEEEALRADSLCDSAARTRAVRSVSEKESASLFLLFVFFKELLRRCR